MTWCEGCHYHEFPYRAEVPISGYGLKEFKSEKDVWDVIDLLIEETKEFNRQGKQFDVAMSISEQLAFFTCKNIVINNHAQNQINKYVYCTETGVAPYEGDYGSQPSIWVETFFAIKHAIAVKQKRDIDNANKR